MAAAPASPHGAPGRVGADLRLRVVSALVLAPVAIAAAYVGGWPFALFWAVAGIGAFWEWARLVGAGRLPTALGAAALASSALLLATGKPDFALALALVGAGLTAALAPAPCRGWSGAGVLYGGALVLAPVVLRRDPDFGLTAIVLLFAVVWASDIAAYFAGRLIGGPKLWPRVSPKKTWSGAIAGTLGAVVAALAVAAAARIGNLAAVAAVSLVLSLVSQAGDLFESAVKRRFGAKDASQLIPGHGGLMDRLDGFVAAALVAAAIGLVRGGLEAPSRGLLIW